MSASAKIAVERIPRSAVFPGLYATPLHIGAAAAMRSKVEEAVKVLSAAVGARIVKGDPEDAIAKVVSEVGLRSSRHGCLRS